MPAKAPHSLSINDRSLQLDDGTRIAYRVEGSGPALVLSNGLTTTTTFWKYLRPIWLRQHTIVTWDLPGHGNSGPARSRDTATIEAQPAIIARVMRAASVARAVQIGWSTGTQIVLETYRQHPELCESLVLLLGGAGHTLDTTRLPIRGSTIDWLACKLPGVVFAATIRTLGDILQLRGVHHIGASFGLIGQAVRPDDVREMTRHMASVDPHTLQNLLHSIQVHDAHDVLASVQVPLLIATGDKDAFASTDLVGLPLWRATAHGQFLRLPYGTHTALLEEPALIATRVLQFVEESLVPEPLPIDSRERRGGGGLEALHAPASVPAAADALTK